MFKNFETYDEARTAFERDRPLHERYGGIFPAVRTYIPTPWKHNYNLAMDHASEILSHVGYGAMDAQASLSTDPNSALPMMLTTMIDPQVYRILFAATKAAEIFGEQRRGTWLDETAMFPVVEHVGEVTSYNDYSEGGSTNANVNWPQRQSYEFQTMLQYGQKELERAGLARINWVSELEQSAAGFMNRFLNLTYFFGVAGLQNYGWLNDPNLPAYITPTVKAAGHGNVWIYQGQINATPNEIFADVQALFYQLVSQSAGLIDQNTSMIMALSPGSEVALTATNSFNVNVSDLLKKNFPNLTIKTAMQYGALSSSNPQGVAGGNVVQLVATEVESQKTGFCSFNEKERSFPIVRGSSSFKQKKMGGTWGAIIRSTIGVSQMIGL